jgi:hypothetical protein
VLRYARLLDAALDSIGHENITGQNPGVGRPKDAIGGRAPAEGVPEDRRSGGRGSTGPVAIICSGAIFGLHTVLHFPVNALNVSGVALGVSPFLKHTALFHS